MGPREETLEQAVKLYEKYSNNSFTSSKAFADLKVNHEELKYISLFFCLERKRGTANVQNKWKFIKDPRLIKK